MDHLCKLKCPDKIVTLKRAGGRGNVSKMRQYPLEIHSDIVIFKRCQCVPGTVLTSLDKKKKGKKT